MNDRAREPLRSSRSMTSMMNILSGNAPDRGCPSNNQLRARNKTHRQALRQLANRWVGILHTCLDRDLPYDEHLAWNHLQPAAA